MLNIINLSKFTNHHKVRECTIDHLKRMIFSSDQFIEVSISSRDQHEKIANSRNNVHRKHVFWTGVLVFVQIFQNNSCFFGKFESCSAYTFAMRSLVITFLNLSRLHKKLPKHLTPVVCCEFIMIISSSFFIFNGNKCQSSRPIRSSWTSSNSLLIRPEISHAINTKTSVTFSSPIR